MPDLRTEIGSFLKKELLDKKVTPERVNEIVKRVELVLNTYPDKTQKLYYGLAKVGTEFPEINSVIVNYLASIK